MYFHIIFSLSFFLLTAMAVCSLLNKIHCQCHLWIGLHRLFAFIHSVYHVSFTRIRFILNIAQLGNFTKHVSFILIFKNLAGSRTREKALYFSPSFSVNTGLIVIRTKYMSRNVVKIRRTREKPDFYHMPHFDCDVLFSCRFFSRA